MQDILSTLQQRFKEFVAGGGGTAMTDEAFLAAVNEQIRESGEALRYLYAGRHVIILPAVGPDWLKSLTPEQRGSMEECFAAQRNARALADDPDWQNLDSEQQVEFVRQLATQGGDNGQAT